MVEYYQLTIEQAIHCIPLLPEWSLAWGMSARTIVRACYDHAIHTLAMERACYLRSLDREVDLKAIRGAFTSARNNLDAATTKVHELEILIQQLMEVHAASEEELLHAQAHAKDVEDTLAVEWKAYTTFVLIASRKAIKVALDKVAARVAMAVKGSLEKVADEEVVHISKATSLVGMHEKAALDFLTLTFQAQVDEFKLTKIRL